MLDTLFYCPNAVEINVARLRAQVETYKEMLHRGVAGSVKRDIWAAHHSELQRCQGATSASRSAYEHATASRTSAAAFMRKVIAATVPRKEHGAAASVLGTACGWLWASVDQNDDAIGWRQLVQDLSSHTSEQTLESARTLLVEQGLLVWHPAAGRDGTGLLRLPC